MDKLKKKWKGWKARWTVEKEETPKIKPGDSFMKRVGRRLGRREGLTEEQLKTLARRKRQRELQEAALAKKKSIILNKYASRHTILQSNANKAKEETRPGDLAFPMEYIKVPTDESERSDRSIRIPLPSTQPTQQSNSSLADQRASKRASNRASTRGNNRETNNQRGLAPNKKNSKIDEDKDGATDEIRVFGFQDAERIAAKKTADVSEESDTSSSAEDTPRDPFGPIAHIKSRAKADNSNLQDNTTFNLLFLCPGPDDIPGPWTKKGPKKKPKLEWKGTVRVQPFTSEGRKPPAHFNAPLQ